MYCGEIKKEREERALRKRMERRYVEKDGKLNVLNSVEFKKERKIGSKHEGETNRSESWQKKKKSGKGTQSNCQQS